MPKNTTAIAHYLDSLSVRFLEPVVHFYLGPLWDEENPQESCDKINKYLDTLLQSLEHRSDLTVLSIDLADNPRLFALFWGHFKAHQDRWVDAIERQPYLKYWGICHLEERGDVHNRIPTNGLNPYWMTVRREGCPLKGYEIAHLKEHESLTSGMSKNHTWLSFNWEWGYIGDHDAYYCKSLTNAQGMLGRVVKTLTERDFITHENADRLRAIMYRSALQKEFRTKLSLEHDIWDQVLSSLLHRYVDTNRVREQGYTIRGDKYYPYLSQEIDAYVEFQNAPAYVWQKLFELCERQKRTTPRAVQTYSYHERSLIDAIIATRLANKYCPIKAIKVEAGYQGLERQKESIERMIKANVAIRFTINHIDIYDEVRGGKTIELQNQVKKDLRHFIKLLKEHQSTLELVFDFSSIYAPEGLKQEVPKEIKALCLEIAELVSQNKREKRQKERGLSSQERDVDASITPIIDAPSQSPTIEQIENPQLKRRSKHAIDIKKQLRVEQQVEAHSFERMAVSHSQNLVDIANQNMATWEMRQQALSETEALSGFLKKDTSIVSRDNCIQMIKSADEALFARYAKKAEKRIIRQIQLMSPEEILSIWDSITSHLETKKTQDEIKYMTKNTWAYLLVHHKQLKQGLDKSNLPEGLYQEQDEDKEILCYDGKSTYCEAPKSPTAHLLYTPKAPSSIPYDLLDENIRAFILSLPASQVGGDHYQGLMSATYLMKDLFCQYGYLLKRLSASDMDTFRHVYKEYGVDGILQVLEGLEYRYLLFQEKGVTDVQYPSEHYCLRAAKSRYRKVYDWCPGYAPQYKPTEQDRAERDKFLEDFPRETEAFTSSLFEKCIDGITHNLKPAFAREIQPIFRGLTNKLDGKQWLSLENLYLKEGIEGVNQVLGRWKKLKDINPNAYQILESVVLTYTENGYQLIKSSYYDITLDKLQSLEPNEIVWFSYLLKSHASSALSIDLPKMLDAFNIFLNELKAIDETLTLPDICSLKDCDNFYVSLTRILEILKRSRSPKEQISLLDNLSLKKEGPLYALTHSDYRLASADMLLSPEHALSNENLDYQESMRSLKEHALNETTLFSDCSMHFFREAGQGHFRFPFDVFKRIHLEVSQLALPDSDKNQLLYLLSMCSSDKRNYHEHDIADIKTLIASISRDKEKSILRLVHDELMINPTIKELIKMNQLLSPFKRETQVQIINTLREKINRYGAKAYDSLSQIDIPHPSQFDLDKHSQEDVTRHKDNFLRAIENQLGGIRQDRIDAFQALLESQYDFSEEASHAIASIYRLLEGAHLLENTLSHGGLLRTLHQIHDKAPLTDVLKSVMALYTDKLITVDGIYPLLCAIDNKKISPEVLKDMLYLPVIASLKADKVSDFADYVKVVSSKTQLRWKEKQLSLSLFIILSNKTLESKTIKAFIDFVAPGLCLLGEESTRFFESIDSLDSNETKSIVASTQTSPLASECQGDLRRLLILNPKAIAILIAHPNEASQKIVFDLLKAYPNLSIENLEVLLGQIDNLEDEDVALLKRLTHIKALPHPTVLMKALETRSLNDLEWNKFGTRDESHIESQLSDKEVLRALSQSESMLPQRPRDNKARALLYKRFKKVNAYSASFLKLSNEVLKKKQVALCQRIQGSTDSDEAAISEITLELIALMREMAYRFGPERNREGLYANATQMLAVIDVLCNKGHMGLQVPTGEGKSLISALISACRTQLSNKPVDLLSSNQTLAMRDFDNYQRFYQGAGIPVSYIEAKSPLEKYLQGETQGINIASAGSMNLFQSKHLFEGTITTVTNHLILDECDDLMLDKRTHYNHPISLHGDDSGSAKTNVWAWVYPALNAFIQTPEFKDTNATRGDDVTRAKSFLARYPTGAIDMGKWKALTSDENNMDAQISTWLDSAVFASLLEEDEDFMVIDETRTDKEGRDVPVRYARILSDGRPDYEAQWGNGVHQCLHARLNQKAVELGQPQNYVIEAEQEIALSTNAKNFIERYESEDKCALSATPGTPIELIELNKKYGFDFYTLPHHRPSKRLELPTLYADNNEMFYQHVLREIKHATDFNKPMLFVCKNTAEVKTLMTRLSQEPLIKKWGGKLQSITGGSPCEEVKNLQKAGQPGMVTIATPMVGRGVDITLENPEKGFRVWQTFTARKRIDIQIKGRSGRQGQVGEYGELLNLAKEPELTVHLKSRYTHHSDISMAPVWRNADKRETDKRLLEESVSDIRNTLNRLYLKYVSSLDDVTPDVRAEWTKLLKRFEEKWSILLEEDNVSLHQKIQKLCDFSDRAWREFVNLKQIAAPKDTGFYEDYMRFVVCADKKWFELDHEVRFDVSPLGEESTERPSQFEAMFSRWNQTIKTALQNESDTLLGRFSAISNVHVHVPEEVTQDVRKHYIRASYDPNLAGHARIYSTLFADERALLTGKKHFFSNFLAYLRHTGTLFAELKAVLKGERPFFANTRMTLKVRRINAHTKEIDGLVEYLGKLSQLLQLYLPEGASTLERIDEDLIRLSQLKLDLAKLGEKFSSDADIEAKKKEIEAVTSHYHEHVLDVSDLSDIQSDHTDNHQAIKSKVLHYIDTHATVSYAKDKKGAFRAVRSENLAEISRLINENKDPSDIQRYIEDIPTGKRGSDLKKAFLEGSSGPDVR